MSIVSVSVVYFNIYLSEWGHEFRPEYRAIAEMRNWDMKKCAPPFDKLAFVPKLTYIPWVALTATASRKVQVDVCSNLKLYLPYTVISSFDRANLKYYVLTRSATTHVDIIRLLLRKYEEVKKQNMKLENGISFPPTLIYVKSRKDCEEISDAIQKFGGRTFDSIGV